LRSIVGRIRPSVEGLLDEGGEISPEIMERAVRANIDASLEQLRHGSEILEQLIRDDGLLIVGAQYCLEQGVVEFFDQVG
jgi:carbonic anhydrase